MQQAQQAAEPLDRQVSVLMTKTELQRIDDIRFERRSPSRGEVIRDLVKKGIEATEQK